MRSIVTWSIHLGLIFSKALCDIQEGIYCGRSCQLYDAKSLHYFFLPDSGIFMACIVDLPYCC